MRIAEDLLARRVDRWITGAIAVLLVTLGFIAGRWNSLATKEVPIVFQEAPGESNSAATAEELKALVEKSPKASTPPSPRMAGATGDQSDTRDADSLGSIVASVNGQKYYWPSCKEVSRIKEENRIWFDSEEEAKESGYEPSSCVLKGAAE